MIHLAEVKNFINDFPYIQFKSEWKIKLVTPYTGATFRFYVELPSGTIKSVYFDRDGNLGADTNYWEVYQIYPKHENLRPHRCDKDDIEKLLKIIGYEELKMTQKELKKIFSERRCFLFSNHQLGNKISVKNFDFAHNNFKYSDLIGATFVNCNFKGSNFESSNLVGSKLNGSNFTDAILSESLLAGSKLISCCFVKADMSLVDFTGSCLKNANFQKTDLSDADFTNCNLDGADFRYANIWRANFTNTNIEGAIGLPKGLNT